MTDVVSQLEVVLTGIEEWTEHDDNCVSLHFNAPSCCDCTRNARVRSKIARTVERMVEAAMDATADLPKSEGWAAAFRATQEQETK